ncbi:hypothetical protein CHUAL_002101 [Chamberlinius hualienensis]
MLVGIYSSQKMYVYHYTDLNSWESIIETKKLKVTPSYSSYAHFGEGAYFTSLPPTSGRLKIVCNNWNGSSRKIHKTSHYIAIHDFDLPLLKKANADVGRDVYVYPLEIDLQVTPYISGTVE